MASEETAIIEPEAASEAAPVSLETTKLVAETPGATVSESRAEAGRTAEEKTEALDEAADATADVGANKSIYELAAGDTAEMSLAIQQIAYVLERHLNIDFVREAPLADVTSGLAHQQAAMSPGRESPQLLDDAVVPPGINNPTDELLPPNIPTGSSVEAEAEAAAALAAGGEDEGKPEAPAASASRAEWNAYAEEVGVSNPSSLASKDEVIAAAEAKA
jgi:hypothetical protein